MAKDFNSPKVVEGYDAHIRKLIPGYEVIHLQWMPFYSRCCHQMLMS